MLRIFELLIALTETVINYALITKVNITRINTLQVFSPASAKILHSYLVIIYAVLIALILHIWPIGVMGMYMVLIPFYPLFQSRMSNMFHLCVTEFAMGIMVVF